MTKKRLTDEELAREAKSWDDREISPANWEDAPEAVPRARESVAISIRLPRPMVEILKEFARRSGVGYQVLLKKWLDERIQQEQGRRRETIQLVSPTIVREAAAFTAGQESKLTESAQIDEVGRMAERLPSP